MIREGIVRLTCRYSCIGLHHGGLYTVARRSIERPKHDLNAIYEWPQ